MAITRRTKNHIEALCFMGLSGFSKIEDLKAKATEFCRLDGFLSGLTGLESNAMKEMIRAESALVKERTYLSELSEKDKKWDVHRENSQSVEYLYGANESYSGLAKRMSNCSTLLGFANITDTDTGEIFLKLRTASFCHVRHCPVCSWRRSLRNTARFFAKLPDLHKHYFPVPHFTFLTLTVKNCPLDELRETLQVMNKAWGAFAKRLDRKKYWYGWIRSTEVTKGKNGTAHPHFHCLLMVPASAFTTKYIKQEDWAEMWRDCLKVNYVPVVDVRKVKAVREGQGLDSAVIETLKYQVKAEDIIDDADWLYGLTEQLHKTRFLATGGVLKDLLKNEMSDDEMISGEEAEGESKSPDVFFQWNRSKKRYIQKS